MGLLKPAVNETAYLKIGILGFEGAGKTFLAAEFAQGMANLGTKKVAWFDTEKSSDFYVKKFKAAGIQLDVHKSRSFKDLVAIIKEAEEGKYDFLIIDSISHVWRDLCDALKKSRGRGHLTMKDWDILKTEWRLNYTDRFTNSKLSIGMLGRAGYEYDMDEDEDGNQEIKKAGTKMKVETETGFEPDILIECFKAPKVSSTTVKGKKRVKKDRGFINKCVVLKDRNDVMNGREIDMPKFKDFKQIIECLNLGGAHRGVDLTRTSDGVFEDQDFSYAKKEKLRTIYLEQLQEALILAKLDGTSKEAKEGRVTTLIKYFGTSAKTSIESMEPTEIKARLDKMKLDLHLMAPETTPEPPALDQADSF